MASTTCLLPKAWSRRHYGLGFWAVAFTFLTLAAFTTVPSPLYGLYQTRDGFSEFMVTVIYAAYAIGVIGALALAGHLSDWYGRRRMLIPAALLTIASAIVFLAWKSVPGLLLARVLSGISFGVASSTATAYLVELHAVYRPQASDARAQLTATTVNMGGLGVGALVAGLLAQSVGDPLTVPFVVFGVATLVALVAVALSPETREPVRPRPSYRPQRVSVPAEARGEFYAAALSALVAFSAMGLFAGLSGLFLRVTLHDPSRALAGATVFALFCAGVIAQLATMTWPVRRELGGGMALMLLGLAATVAAVWLPTPSLALFILGGAVTGAGCGAVFKGAVGTVIRISRPESRAEALTGLFLAGFVGLSVPIVGAGVALAASVSARLTLLGFAIAVSAGIVASAINLLPRRNAQPALRARSPGRAERRHDSPLRQARARPGPPSTRVRGADLPSRLRLTGHGHEGAEQGPATGRALDQQPPVESVEAIAEPQQAATPIEARPAHAVVAHLHPERPILQARAHLGPAGA
jgi:MFS family permease